MAERARTKTHYETLGIPTGADPAEIRRAYVALARRFHPDAHAGRSPAERAHADRRMRDVNEAWSALSDPVRRRAYDESLTRARRDGGPARPRPPGRPWTPRPDDDAWMQDFGSWREETDVLPPDPPGPRRPVRLLPAGILLAATVVGVFGLVLSSRPILAGAFMLGGISAALWIWLPLVELARSRASDPDR